ncbi:MAG TPA: UDP-N-acetylglucosamine 1-carboxyvinyltransferase [bacterium]|nr:UDP-N-acetylglucosamine 1-carboxyvinyltransferase [bacterium]HPQ67226.1 UDP-N-acetylglucosamine 1-carboxyvinyltransferase [bacterium]
MLERIEVVGGRTLRGEVGAGGAKNAVLPIMAAALLAPGRSVIENVPRLRDVEAMLGILRGLGVEGGFVGDGVLELDASRIGSHVAPYDQVRKMRASILVLGALLGRLGRARVSLPGGCVIGPRPVDLHIRGLAALGARIGVDRGYIEASGPLPGGEVLLEGRHGSSVGATLNLMLAAVRSRGETVISNAAMEPEVSDTAGFLSAMGAVISGAGTPEIRIQGVDGLVPAHYRVIPDRIEAGTYLVAGALAGGEVTVRDARAEQLRSLLEVLEKMGVSWETLPDGIRVTRASGLKPVDVVTHPFPGFPTDMQAQIMVLLALAEGTATVTETVFPERFMHVPELNRMGAAVTVEGPTAVVRGVERLSGAPVMASDLRASAALVLAALAARGETVIRRVYHLDRGYADMVGKLRSLGAEISRRPD